MNFFLKILNEVRSRESLKVDGASGLRYIFRWDAKLRAYRFQPAKQDEVDDLYRTMGRTTSYVFAPVNNEVVVPFVEPTIPATPPNALCPPEVSKLPLEQVLVEAALLRGIVVTEDDTNEIVTRLSQAYDRGATDSLNAQAASKRKPRAKDKAAAA